MRLFNNSKKEVAGFNTTLSHEILSRTIIDNTTEFDGVRFANVPIELFRIDDSYQRPTDKKHVNTLATGFKKIYASVLTASYRDGWFYIIDGQHRYNAAVVKGIEKLACIIVTGLTVQEEAKMFKDLNINHKKPDPYKIFKANICNGDMSDPEVARDMEIKRICDKYNIEVKKVGRGSGSKVLRCLTRAQDIMDAKAYGTECFEWILDLLNTSDWADDSDTYRSEIVRMLKGFWVDNKDVKNIEETLIKALNSTTPKSFISRARSDYDKYGIDTAMGLCLRDMIQEVSNGNKKYGIRVA